MTSGIPLVASLLLLAMPGLWLLGRRLGDLVFEDPWLERLLAPAFSISAWMLLIHVLGTLTHRFYLALWTGTLALSATGIGWTIRQRKIQTGQQQQTEPSELLLDGSWMWAGAVVSIAMLAPAALGWAFHDEVNLFGHMSVASELLNGWYPPRHPSFPQFVLHYHVGFDVLVASTAALLHLPVDHVIDLITLTMWGYTWLLLWTAGRLFIPGRLGALAAPIVMFGGGLPVLAESELPSCNVCDWLGGTIVDHAYSAPPIISMFFQHPWTTGLPLGLSALIVAVGSSTESTKPKAAAMALILAALSFNQAVIFAALAASIPAYELWKTLGESSSHQRHSYRLVVATAVASVTALVVALVLPGPFSLLSPVPGPSWLVFKLGPTVHASSILRWDAASYGLSLVLGPLGFLWMRRNRARLLVLLATGSLITVHVIAHRISWDIIKFAFVAQVALGLGTSAALAHAWAKLRSSVTRGALGLSTLLLIAPGLVFSTVFAVFPDSFPRRYMARHAVPIANDDKAIATWLRRRSGPMDLVALRSPRDSWAYAAWAGLPELWLSRKRIPVMLFPAKIVASRVRIVTTWPRDVAAYREQGVRWVVVSPRDKHQELRKLAERWHEAGVARLVFQAGDKRVYELVGGS